VDPGLTTEQAALITYMGALLSEKNMQKNKVIVRDPENTTLKKLMGLLNQSQLVLTFTKSLERVNL
jgi:hypothetical protein